MNTFGGISIGLLLAYFVQGFSPPPAWDCVEGKDVAFFKAKGFEFALDDSMAHHHEKPTVEISILIPYRFVDTQLTNEFRSVMLLNEDIATGLAAHPHAGKNRVILTISEAMTSKSEVAFYFRNGATNVTHGAVYVLNLAWVLEDWKKNRKNKPNNGAALNGHEAAQSELRNLNVSQSRAEQPPVVGIGQTVERKGKLPRCGITIQRLEVVKRRTYALVNVLVEVTNTISHAFTADLSSLVASCVHMELFSASGAEYEIQPTGDIDGPLFDHFTWDGSPLSRTGQTVVLEPMTAHSARIGLFAGKDGITLVNRSLESGGSEANPTNLTYEVFGVLTSPISGANWESEMLISGYGRTPVESKDERKRN